MGEPILDPEIQAVLDAYGEFPSIDLAQLPLADAMRLARPDIPAPPMPANCEDRHFETDDGDQLRVRFYYPELPGGPRPVVLYLHGGGFVGGSIEMDDLRCSRLALAADCVVASLDYRLAPEHPFPAAIHDAYRAWNWLGDHAGALQIDKRRAAVYGSSAGGHIAIGMTRLAIERRVLAPKCLLFANPALDPSMASASFSEFRDGPFMTAARMAWYWRQYQGCGNALDQRMWSPLQDDLALFPPTHIMTAEYDVLRDEGELFAEQLQNAGVPATITRYPGMIHGFMTVVPEHPASREAMAQSADILRARLADSGRA